MFTYVMECMAQYRLVIGPVNCLNWKNDNLRQNKRIFCVQTDLLAFYPNYQNVKTVDLIYRKSSAMLRICVFQMRWTSFVFRLNFKIFPKEKLKTT